MRRIAPVILAAFVLTLKVTADDTTPEAVAAQSNNGFAIDIYPRFAETKGNFCFSPYSAESALAMAWAGARGETARQMTRVLHLGEDRATVHEDFGALMAKLNSEKAYQLFVANSIWCQQGFPLRSEFLKIVRDQYGAVLNQVDFQGAPEAARQQINDWVTKATWNKIEDIVPKNTIDGSTRLLLADAIYFKAPWHDQFHKEGTKMAAFHGGSGHAEDVPMMHLQSIFSYGESKTLQVLDLPYASRKISMILFLPKDVNGLGELERSLTDISMTQMLAWVKPQEVNVFLPRFKFSTALKLGDTLQAMGMTDAFSPDFAKFSGMAEEPLFIGAVLQKAYIDVNEDGTEAAAATVMTMAEGAAPTPPPLVFRADRPFMFLIRHNDTGAILFMGRVTEPQGS
jgi:serpin B